MAYSLLDVYSIATHSYFAGDCEDIRQKYILHGVFYVTVYRGCENETGRDSQTLAAPIIVEAID